MKHNLIIVDVLLFFNAIQFRPTHPPKKFIIISTNLVKKFYN
jgi:hypothetical protein